MHLLNNSPKAITSPYRAISLALLASVISMFSTDIYLPSLPELTLTFSTSDKAVRMSIAIFIFGLAISELIYGPLSDRYGRKPSLLIGLVIALIGSLVCLFSQTITIFLFGRLIQGVGAASGFGMMRAIATDCFQGEKLAKVSSVIVVFITASPAVAPVIGGYLEEWFHWKSIFIFLSVAFVLLLIIITLFLEETAPLDQTKHKTSSITLYINLLKQNLHYRQFILINCLALSALMFYFSVAPFLYQDVFGLTPVLYGWTSIFVSIGLLTGAVINIRWVSTFGFHALIKFGSIVLLFSCLVMLITGFLYIINVWVVLIPMLFYKFGHIFIQANCFAGAMYSLEKSAGIAGAFFAFSQMITAAITTFLASFIPITSQLPMALCMTLILLINLAIIFKYFKKLNTNK